MYRWSVELRGYISPETGKAPNAYLWMSEGCEKVKAVMVSQQNMAEEALFKMPSFRRQMAELGIALLWVAPAFSNNWDPSTGCQSIFEEMMAGTPKSSKLPSFHLVIQPKPPFLGTLQLGIRSARFASSLSTAMPRAPIFAATVRLMWSGGEPATSMAFPDLWLKVNTNGGKPV